jgi:hypothetical protein
LVMRDIISCFTSATKRPNKYFFSAVLTHV